jgi:stage II sporulation protein AA (anti-sigma F factor antagonist)
MTRTTESPASVSTDTVGAGTEILSLDGEFDMSNCAEVERRLSDAALGREPPDIVVDLRGVSFLDSTVLELLLRELKKANERGSGFALIRPNALVWRVFVLTGVSERFVTYSSLREALSEL